MCRTTPFLDDTDELIDGTNQRMGSVYICRRIAQKQTEADSLSKEQLFAITDIL